MAVVAHVGHDLVTLAMFAPAIGFLTWLAVSQARERRRARDERSGSGFEG